MQVVGNRKIFFVNAREPRTWETEVNSRLAALANNNPKYPNAHVIDWHTLGNQHDDWFVNDGIHLTGRRRAGLRHVDPRAPRGRLLTTPRDRLSGGTPSR